MEKEIGKKQKWRGKSLSGQLRFFTRLIMIILLIPAVTSLLVTALYAVSFQRSVSLMGGVAALRPVVEDEIPEQLWSVIAGRSSFDESGVNETIRRVNGELDEYLREVPSDTGSRITVARRTMDTLASYADQVRQEMEDKKIPVTVSEATLEEVRSVANLVGNMLEEFIEDEALEVNRKNAAFQRTVAYVVGISILLLLGALVVTSFAGRRQTDSVRSSIGYLEQIGRAHV